MLHRRWIYTRILPLSEGQKVRLRAIVPHLVKCHSFHKPLQWQKNTSFGRCNRLNWLCLEGPSCEKLKLFFFWNWMNQIINSRPVLKSLQYGQCLWSILLHCETHTSLRLHPAPPHTSFIVYSEYSVAPTLSPCGLDQSAVIMLIWAVSHWEKKKKGG